MASASYKGTQGAYIEHGMILATVLQAYDGTGQAGGGTPSHPNIGNVSYGGMSELLDKGSVRIEIYNKNNQRTFTKVGKPGVLNDEVFIRPVDAEEDEGEFAPDEFGVPSGVTTGFKASPVNYSTGKIVVTISGKLTTGDYVSIFNAYRLGFSGNGHLEIEVPFEILADA